MAPSPSSWDLAWPEIGVVIVVALAYALATRRHAPSTVRIAAFAGAGLLVVATFVTPIGTLARDYLLSAHLFQNVALAEWAPALGVLGLSMGMVRALAARPVVRALTRPRVALPLWLATYGIWHVPAVYDAALRNDLLLHLEHASYFLAGAALWWPVFHAQPWRMQSGAKALYVFAAFVLASPIGLLLALVPSAVYDFYVEAPRVWGLSPLADQQIAGVIMAVSEAVVFFGVFAVYFLRFMAEEERGEAGLTPGRETSAPPP
jgi:cytochrome c oxidase assembly factor CtaG